MSTEELARLTLYTTLGAVAVNLLLTFLTAIYVFFTRQMAKQMRAARGPSVYIDLEFPDRRARVVIGNSGESPAFNVRFDIKEDVPWQEFGSESVALTSIEALRTGISFLPSKRVLKFMGDDIDWAQLNTTNGLVDVKISYNDETDAELTRDYQINVAQYSKVLVESYRDSSADVAKAIREAEMSRSTAESMKGISRQLFARPKKTCPMCAESIPRAARKCPKCLELLPSVTEA